MRVFERIGTWLWTFGKGVQPSPSEISNDELVIAHEWLTIGGAFPLPDNLAKATREAREYGAPDITATLRKLGAR